MSFPTIKKLFTLLLFGLIGLWLFAVVQPTSAAVGINKQIRYQGRLTDSNGNNVADGNYNFKISIYDAATEGSCLWTYKGTTETPEAVAVAVADGIFNVVLGDTAGSKNAMTLDFNSDSYYLGVTVGADAEMTPRLRIGAAGYAFNADKLDGSDWAEPAAIGTTDPAAGTFTDLTASGTLDFPDNSVAWADVNKTGSSLADLATKSAAALTSGNLDIARMPTGGSWSLSSDLNIDSNLLVVSQDDDRIGIGAADPQSQLHLYKADTNTEIRFQADYTVPADGDIISSHSYYSNDDSNPYEFARMEVAKWYDAPPDDVWGASFKFYTRDEDEWGSIPLQLGSFVGGTYIGIEDDTLYTAGSEFEGIALGGEWETEATGATAIDADNAQPASLESYVGLTTDTGDITVPIRMNSYEAELDMASTSGNFTASPIGHWFKFDLDLATAGTKDIGYTLMKLDSTETSIGTGDRTILDLNYGGDRLSKIGEGTSAVTGLSGQGQSFYDPTTGDEIGGIAVATIPLVGDGAVIYLDANFGVGAGYYIFDSSTPLAGINLSMNDSGITLGNPSTSGFTPVEGGSLDIYGDASDHLAFQVDSGINYNVNIGSLGLATAPNFTTYDISGNIIAQIDNTTPAVTLNANTDITGNLDVNGDVTITGTLVTQNVESQTDDTYYLGKNDDDTPAAYKGIILKDQAGTGKYYRLEVYNDALRIVDLTD